MSFHFNEDATIGARKSFLLFLGMMDFLRNTLHMLHRAVSGSKKPLPGESRLRGIYPEIKVMALANAYIAIESGSQGRSFEGEHTKSIARQGRDELGELKGLLLVSLRNPPAIELELNKSSARDHAHRVPREIPAEQRQNPLGDGYAQECAPVDALLDLLMHT
jgi:hypothetical protein